MKKTCRIVIFVLSGAALFFSGRRCGNGHTAAVTRVDTLVVRDTVRDTILVPASRRPMRTDTVWMRVKGDTVFVEVEVPVERKIYQTADYRAVVEGFRPTLAEMEIYRNTAVITRETTLAPKLRRRNTPGRWGMGIQAGYGITPQGPAPYIGVGVHYNIITW